MFRNKVIFVSEKFLELEMGIEPQPSGDVTRTTPLFGPIWGFNREEKNSHISLFRFLKSTSGIIRKPDKDRAATTAKSVKSKNTVWNTNCRAGV